MADYRPTKEEKAGVVRAFMRLLKSKPTAFQIGRCADDGKGGLSSREMYSDARSITSIWTGPPGKVAWFEKALIRAAWRTFPDRCRNEIEGGGGQGEAETHHVYVVQWDMTAEIADEIQFNRLIREVDEYAKLEGA